jgi:hypothetical protein
MSEDRTFEYSVYMDANLYLKYRTRMLYWTSENLLTSFFFLSIISLPCGLALLIEGYRRYVLPHLIDTMPLPSFAAFSREITPFLIIMVYILWGIRFARRWWWKRKLRKIWIPAMVHYRIDNEGLSISSGQRRSFIGWTEVDDVSISSGSVAFKVNTQPVLIPHEAFDETNFVGDMKAILELWRSKRATTTPGQA